MKKLFFSPIVIMFLGLMVIGFSSCNKKAENQAPETELTKAEGGHSKYVCQMYCKGSGSDKEGSCQVCGMDLSLRSDLEDASENGHDHDH